MGVRPHLNDSRANARRVSSPVGVLSRAEGASALVRFLVTRTGVVREARANLLTECRKTQDEKYTPTCGAPRTTERVTSPRSRVPRTR